ncbi:MAG: SpoIIE family protein phosphatase [Oscillospiraceae bacterium]|nr:SpoIIE family protein phosphatase [Oscillospiraceae bacterium]
MRNIEWTARLPRAAQLTGSAVRLSLCTLLTGAQIFGGYAPLGLGMVAASGAGAGGLFALAGSLLGTLAFMDFAQGLRYLAVCLLLFSANNAFCETRFMQRRLFLPIAAASLMLCVELIYLAHAPVQQIAYCIAALLLTAVSAYLFTQMLKAPEAVAESEQQCAWLLAAAGVLMTVSRLGVIGGVSPGRVLAALAALLLAYDQGGNVAFCCGAALGLAMDLCAQEQTFVHTAVYGLGAFCVGLRARGKRHTAALRFAVPAALLLLPLPDEAGLAALYEVLAATLAFLVLPTRLLRSGKRLRPIVTTREQLKGQLDDAAAAFRELYETLLHAPQKTQENPACIFDHAAEQVCRSCTLCSLCWEREYVSTYNALNDATSALLSRGHSKATDFPAHFSNRCIHFSEFRGAVDHHLSVYLLRRAYNEELARARKSAKGQYAYISELLSSAAAHVAKEARPAFSRTKRAYLVGMALRAKEGENTCGDSATFFEAGDKLYILLSDGMGGGEAAQRESSLAVRLLERFLRSGIDVEPALKTLNAALTLRSDESLGFTTVDLCVVPLCGGEAEVYKYGAAPSYTKRMGRVRRVSCRCLPAGLLAADAPPEQTCVTLEDASFFVMVTDGIADEADDEWLQNLLAGWSGENPQSLAAAVMAESLDHKGRSDDCGVVALYLPSSEEARGV